jgi:diguanylate cyclase
MSAHLDVTGAPAALAKAALHYLAERRLGPTPENFAHAWREVGGPVSVEEHSAREFAQAMLRELSDAGVLSRETAGTVLQAVRDGQWQEAARLAMPAIERRMQPVWGPLLERLIAAYTIAHRGWTPVRKREYLRRLVEDSPLRDDLLAARIGHLLETWAHDGVSTPTVSVPASDAAPEAGEDAQNAQVGQISQAVPEAAGGELDPAERADGQRWRQDRLLAEMTELLTALCGSLASVAEEGSWIREQAEALRETLADPTDHRALAQVRTLLAQTNDVQRALSGQRHASIAALKHMLAEWVTSMGALADTTDQFGSRVSAHAARIEEADSIASLADTVQGLLTDARSMRATLDESREGIEAARARAGDLEREVSRLERELAATSSQMVTDFLTDTMNRRGLEQSFAEAVRVGAATQTPLCLVVLDVDDFKRLNDTLGHQGGDDALRQLARILKDKARPGDSVARYGGEEFVLLMPGLPVDAAAEQLHRLQRDVTSHVFLHESTRSFITFSAGITEVRARDSLSSAIGRADEAMYAAKRAGKNCVRIG